MIEAKIIHSSTHKCKLQAYKEKEIKGANCITSADVCSEAGRKHPR